MKNLINKAIIEPLRDALLRLEAFLPNLLTGVIVFVAGLLVAWLVKLLVVKLFKLFKLDAVFTRAGLTDALQKMAVKDPPARLVGRMFFWLVAIIFSILSLSVMKVPLIDELLGKFLLYLPSVFAALVILSLGWFLGNFLGRAVLIASVNAGVTVSGLLSKGVKAVVLLFAFVMAFDELGIGRNTVIAGFTIVFGGAVLALALAFGLGGRDLARKYLEKRFEKGGDVEEDDLKHL